MQNRLANSQKIESPFYSDTQFDGLYSPELQQLSQRHWTPLSVARKAAKFLATKRGVKVLDIGSGIGKFCLAAASSNPHAIFCGVEQRRDLVYHADKVKGMLELKNVSFRHCNFTQLNFQDYDHFYFYNSFYENLIGTDKIDNNIFYSTGLYNYYNRYLYTQLGKMPTGTRVVTFHSLEDEIPPSYQLVNMERDNLLKCWIKI
jgi:hypothetical protein